MEKHKLKDSIKFWSIFFMLWLVNLLIVFSGIPFLLYWELKKAYKTRGFYKVFFPDTVRKRQKIVLNLLGESKSNYK
jgi:hypothetical protein